MRYIDAFKRALERFDDNDVREATVSGDPRAERVVISGKTDDNGIAHPHQREFLGMRLPPQTNQAVPRRRGQGARPVAGIRPVRRKTH